MGPRGLVRRMLPRGRGTAPTHWWAGRPWLGRSDDLKLAAVHAREGRMPAPSGAIDTTTRASRAVRIGYAPPRRTLPAVTRVRSTATRCHLVHQHRELTERTTVHRSTNTVRRGLLHHSPASGSSRDGRRPTRTAAGAGAPSKTRGKPPGAGGAAAAPAVRRQRATAHGPQKAAGRWVTAPTSSRKRLSTMSRRTQNHLLNPHQRNLPRVPAPSGPRTTGHGAFRSKKDTRATG